MSRNNPASRKAKTFYPQSFVLGLRLRSRAMGVHCSWSLTRRKQLHNVFMVSMLSWELVLRNEVF